MRKLAIAIVVTASLARATLALADDTPAVTGPATTTDPPPPATGNRPTTPSTEPTSTTRTTSSDVTAAAPPVTTMYETDTTTLYRRVRPNKALLITGGATFLGAYGTTVGLTAANIDSARVTESLYIPVVGPWLALGDRDCRECTKGQNTLDTALVTGSGILQGAGLGLVIASFIVPEKIPAATISAGPVKMTFTATSVGRDAASIGAVGSF